jgi:hypothetical protein
MSTSLHEANEFVQQVLTTRNKMQEQGHMPMQLASLNRIFKVRYRCCDMILQQ